MSTTRVLVTGANGYGGARLYFDLAEHFGKGAVTGTYHSRQLGSLIRLDVTDRGQVIDVIRASSPEFIVHVASNPFIKWCEQNPEEAKRINQDGTANLVEAANSVGAKVVYVSTDRVLEPINVYSRTKLAAEDITKTCMAGFVIVRPAGIVMGYSPNTQNDRAFNRLLRNIEGKTPAVYDNSWISNVTWMGHLSEVIIQSMERRLFGETIPVATPEMRSRYDLARDILSNFDIPVTPKNDEDKSPVIKMDLSRLRELGLPEYGYSQIIPKIVDEIKHAERFFIS